MSKQERNTKLSLSIRLSTTNSVNSSRVKLDNKKSRQILDTQLKKRTNLKNPRSSFTFFDFKCKQLCQDKNKQKQQELRFHPSQLIKNKSNEIVRSSTPINKLIQFQLNQKKEILKAKGIMVLSEPKI